ncbi:MAG: UbiD family decarboxylase [Trichloromonadaceae bacterium]
MPDSFPDLRCFVATLEQTRALTRIKAPVDAYLEIAALTQRVGHLKQGGPALLFESPRGFSWRVATNLLGSPQRAALAWGPGAIEALAKRLGEDLAAVGCGAADQRLTRILAQTDYSPRLTANPQWVCSDDADLGKLPALHCWPQEAGPYLTLPVVVTRHPITGQVNYGLYRLQRLDPKRAAIHFNAGAGAAEHLRAWSDLGQPMPVAVLLGAPPALLAAAAMPLPSAIDEAAFAGYLTDSVLECSPGPITGLPVAVSTEIVLEGSITEGELELEGPFGNHSGRYVEASLQPVFRLQGLYHRPEPILPATVVGPPPMEDCYLAQVNSRLLLPLWACDQPQLLDIHLPLEGIFHGAALLSVAAGSGREVIRSLWGSKSFARSRLLVALPPDIDIRRPEQVYWHALNAVDPNKDLLLQPGQLGIDASRPRPGVLVAADAGTAALIESRWKEYFPDAE